jgi:hypothetical protein
MTRTNSLLIRAVLCILVMLSATSYHHFRGTTATDAATRFDSGRMFDKYGALSVTEENARLDNLATQLGKEQGSKAYVVVYEGSEDGNRDLKSSACRAMRRLLANRDVDPRRVFAMVIGCGHRENFTVELWMWPIGAPDDLPRFQLGVSEDEVSIIKGVEVTRKCGRKH